ncbi:MAG: hypothetical protein ABSE86_02005 [Bryobacteraceae bacterium]|jgi:hypothetical protein
MSALRTLPSGRGSVMAGVVCISSLLLAETPKVPEPYQSIVELSRAVPPEFAAEALLRVVESNKITNKDAKRDLVERAFRLGAMAKSRVRMHGVAGTTVDTRSGYLSRAYDLKLDALSLQSRAVRNMVTIDPAKARELFLEIPRPALPQLTCYDPLFYDVADFYQALGAVVETAFTPQERKKEEDLNFLLDYLGQASSPAQLAPLARVIKSANISTQQRDILWTKFDGLLESIQPDGRSFASALDDIRAEIIPAAEASFEKFRQSSKGCRDDSRPGVTLDLSDGPVHAGKTPTVEHYWESSAAKQLLEGAQKLRFTADGKLIPDSERASREWQDKLTDFLSQLGDWTSSQEKSEADYYHEKCVVYEALVELIPPGPQRDKTLQAYLDFISNSSLQRESPLDWFMHAQWMLERVNNSSNGEPSKLLSAFEGSGNAVLVLYAAEEKVFGGQVPAWVTNSK